MSSQKINQSRRGFLTAKLFSREGRENIARKQHRSGLLPPGLEKAISSDSCSSCAGFCVQSCPREIIKLHPNDHDFRGQPYLDFSHNGCTFCMDCTGACPQINDARKIASLGKAILNQQQCYAWLNIVCMSCSNACEYELISFNENSKPSIAQEACTGCGFCIKSCPASAITIV